MKAKDICQVSIGTVLISICAWISVPSAVPFTMQTFAVFCVLLILGGRKGTLAIFLYLLMGLAGLPVFSGFMGGPVVLLSVTGGYLIGFILIGSVYWLLSKVTKDLMRNKLLSLIVGLLACYLFGSIWLAINYGGINMLYKAVCIGVFPFIIPDAIKLLLAFYASRIIKRHIRY